MADVQQFTSDPMRDGWLWPSAEECIDVDDLEPGMAYYERTVTYGPWIKKEVPR